MYGLGDAMFEEREVTDSLEGLIRLFTKEELFDRVKEKAEDPDQMMKFVQAIKYVFDD